MNDILFRIEEDSLGEVAVPIDALYGSQTQRALSNFQVTGRKPWWDFVHSLALIKKAAANVNSQLGLLDPKISSAIIKYADEILSGKYKDSFLIDPIQAGAGTSLNMNINEVIGNLATIHLGGELGFYLVHPNDHVNMSQSTNDVIPTAIRIGILIKLPKMVKAIENTISLFRKQSFLFDKYIKSGRTHLQDAIPIRLGQEFNAYADTLNTDLQRIKSTSEWLKRLPIGGTAIGSGLNAHPEYHKKMVNFFRNETGIEFKESENLFETTQSMADIAAFSCSLRVLAISMTKIANDLRLLSSGPNTGIAEINLPPVQPGSSIMPGKVNPVMMEMMNMAMYHVMGSDATISIASQAGELELNVMMPIIGHHTFEMINTIIGAFNSINKHCLDKITANPKMLNFWLKRNPIIITILNPLIGYKKGAELVNLSESTGASVIEIAMKMARENNLKDINTGELINEESIKNKFNDLYVLTNGGIFN